jgi:hypothetical protein
LDPSGPFLLWDPLGLSNPSGLFHPLGQLYRLSQWFLYHLSGLFRQWALSDPLFPYLLLSLSDRLDR